MFLLPVCQTVEIHVQIDEYSLDELKFLITTYHFGLHNVSCRAEKVLVTLASGCQGAGGCWLAI